jgi:hypothetical protein
MISRSSPSRVTTISFGIKLLLGGRRPHADRRAANQGNSTWA